MWLSLVNITSPYLVQHQILIQSITAGFTVVDPCLNSKKCDKFCCIKGLSREPNILPYILDAKAIMFLIIEKTEGVTGLQEEIFSCDNLKKRGERIGC